MDKQHRHISTTITSSGCLVEDVDDPEDACLDIACLGADESIEVSIIASLSLCLLALSLPLSSLTSTSTSIAQQPSLTLLGCLERSLYSFACIYQGSEIACYLFLTQTNPLYHPTKLQHPLHPLRRLI